MLYNFLIYYMNTFMFKKEKDTNHPTYDNSVSYFPPCFN